MNLTMNLTQSEMMTAFGPAITYGGKSYAKKTKVRARLAVEGEFIVTMTSDGKETQNTAKAGDYVVENQTEAKEQYIISGVTFKKRYAPLFENSEVEDSTTFRPYKATGKCIGITYKGVVDSKDFSVIYPSEIKFIAPWNEEMILKPGDMLVSALPDTKSVYRIAAKEFAETYEAE